MNKPLVAALLALLALPLSAQSTTATVFITSQTNSGGSDFPLEGMTLSTEFDSGSGFGLALSRSFGRVSGELAIFRTSSEGNIENAGTSVFSLGDVDLTPITAMVRYHFKPSGPLDVYAGGGVAYVMTGDLSSDDGPIELDNETAAVIGAGITYDFSPHIGVALDVRYIPLSLSARPSAQEERIEADIDPLLISAGLRIRF